MRTNPKLVLTLKDSKVMMGSVVWVLCELKVPMAPSSTNSLLVLLFVLFLCLAVAFYNCGYLLLKKRN